MVIVSRQEIDTCKVRCVLRVDGKESEVPVTFPALIIGLHNDRYGTAIHLDRDHLRFHVHVPTLQ
ncbi:hypothetical protein D3C85_1745000 [compost metagenome]